MRRVLVTLVALAGLSGAAGSQGATPTAARCGPGISGGVVGLDGPHPPTVAIMSPLCPSGTVVIRFRSRPAGCRAGGPCGYAGTVMWRPRAPADLTLIAERRGGRLRPRAGLVFTDGLHDVHTTVRRTRGGTCRVTQSGFGAINVDPARDGLAFTVGDPSAARLAAPLLNAPCAGPLDPDLRGALPTTILPFASVRAGNATINLSGTRTFRSRFFVGEVISTLRLVSGGVSTEKLGPSRPGPGPHMRNLIERYRVTRLSGTFRIAVQGSRDPKRCRRFDACGAQGSYRAAFTVGSGARFFVDAAGPARRPLGDFLAAVGRGVGNPAGLQVDGSGTLPMKGRLSARMLRPRTCADTATIGTVVAGLTPAHGSLTASLELAPLAGSLRTRCAGPLMSDAELATGTVPAAGLGAPALSVTLHGRTAHVGAYTLTATGTATLTIVHRSQAIQIF